jgi:hypothetical protein
MIAPISPHVLWRVSLAGLCAAALAPLLLVDMPPLLDYPNHLARLVVLAADGGDKVLAQYYTPHWRIIPDLGIDLTGVWLLRLLPVSIAGRLLIAMALLLEVFGVIAYARAVVGRTFWSLAAGLVIFNETLLLGFLNFTAAIGLALLLAAAWLRWRERHPARVIALAVPGAVALFFCHLMGLLLFALLIGAHELAALWPLRHGFSTVYLLRAAVQRLTVLAGVFVVPLLLYAGSDLRHMAGNAEFLSPSEKFAQLLVPFVNYSLLLDRLTAGLTIGFVGTCLVTRRCRIPLRAGLVITALSGVYLVAPFAYKGTANLDTRLVIFLGLLLFAGLTPRALPAWAARGSAVVFVLLFALRMGVLDVAWSRHAVDLAELRATIASVHPGDRVFLTTVSPDEAPDAWRNGPPNRRLSNGQRTDVHTAALLLIERRAWWPFLFDNPSQQPIETREPYRTLALRVGGIVDHDAITAADLCGFDHLLLLEAGDEPDLAGFARGRMDIEARSDYAALFAIRPNPLCSAY